MSGFFAASGLETAVLSRRFRLFAVGALVGATLVVLAVAFLAFAAYLALLPLVAPWQAALIVGGGALVFGGILLLVAVNAFGRAADQVQVAVKTAVKTNVLVRAAPLAAGLATRNPRLIATLAALAGALIALIRAFGARPAHKPDL
ncbi:MAG TPA: hypothetical protein VMU18_04580 [Rhodoblastus sp.]|nr:hypothetical protein [Rhodoblastus sp.]